MRGEYTAGDIRRMLSELRAVSTLWPKGASPAVITTHATWRAVYHEYRYKKWYGKLRRKG